MEKRGVSTIVSTMIIILLVIVAIGIVWFVVRGVVTGGAEEVSIGRLLIDLDIDNAYIDEEDTSIVYVTVSRGPGKGTLKGIKFIFSDGDNTKVTEQEVSMDELEQETFNFNIASLGIAGASEISIAPITEGERGGEIQGDIIATRTLTLGSGGGILGGENCGNGVWDDPEDCDGGLNCESNCVCSSNFVPTVPPSIDCEASGVGGPTCNDSFWDGTIAGGDAKCTDSHVVCVENSECTNNVCGEDESIECETTGLGCLTNCLCDRAGGYEPSSPKFLESCAVELPFWDNSGAVSSVWPGDAPRYFDSPQLPKDATISEFLLTKYVKFTSGTHEINCISIIGAKHVIDPISGYNMSHLEIALVGSMVPTDTFKVWNSSVCGVPV